MPTTTRSKRKHQLAELEAELRRCAQRGDDFARMRELVEIERVSVNCADDSGYTSLMNTAFGGHAQMARFLLDNGADMDAASNTGYTALAAAIIGRHGALVEILLEYDADIEAQCGTSSSTLLRSPLGLAIACGYVDMLTLLLRHGANTKETIYNGKRFSALLLACLGVGADGTTGHERRMAIAQVLLDHDDGVDINDFSPQGDRHLAISPLCAACLHNSMALARLLIERGARVIYDGVFPDVPCPLSLAVQGGSLELVQFLLDNASAGGSMRSVENDDETPSHPHPLSLPLETALNKTKLDVAQLLVDYGADVNEKPFLWLNAKNGRSTESSLFLLRNGANVNQADSASGATPLWAAAEQGNAELVQELLKAGADVNIRDCDGEKPIWVAYRKGHKRVVHLLLRTSPNVWSRLRDVW